MLLVFPSQKDFVLVFRGAKSPRAQKGSLPTIHPRISPKIPQSYPQIPLQTLKYARFDKSYRATLTDVENDSCSASMARTKNSLSPFVVLIHRGAPAFASGSSRNEQ